MLIANAYSALYLSGISAWLWQWGVWFNANDVLHLLLIVWALYIRYNVSYLIEDSN